MLKKTKERDAKLAAHRNGSRRSFLKYGGATVAATGLVLAGCDPLEDLFPEDEREAALSRVVELLRGDTGVLNYALVLEQLEAAFYIEVVDNPYSGISEEEFIIMRDLRDHEIVHRDFLKAALGQSAIPTLTFDFSSIDFTSRDSVLNASKTFEDLGVAAYNGAGRLLKSPDLLLIAGKIVSVEGRHAAAIRSILDEDPQSFAGDDIIDANGLDRAFDPETVLKAAAPFIINEINANELIGLLK
ncbi:ferritin-like domain-containing protein [Pleomorphovibrio marinus]|uniref:ferritin-like domain-containing protein n=1 Tax=Pleomorphovibrio marinus TaxID=2164132 RepID=UPI000E0AF4F3|nr:ferritin-like domain-containing protein [Pleomorphovibrio marinus]